MSKKTKKQSFRSGRRPGAPCSALDKHRNADGERKEMTITGLMTTTNDAISRDQVMICYSHKDARWRDRVTVHLSPLQRKGLIDLWSDRRIEVGDQWRDEINRALARACVVLLLVSPDLLASDFIQDAELPALLAAAQKGGCRVIPILVAPSAFSDMPALSRFQHANPDGLTLLEMGKARSERLLADIARRLLRLSGGSLD